MIEIVLMAAMLMQPPEGKGSVSMTRYSNRIFTSDADVLRILGVPRLAKPEWQREWRSLAGEKMWFAYSKVGQAIYFTSEEEEDLDRRTKAFAEKLKAAGCDIDFPRTRVDMLLTCR